MICIQYTGTAKLRRFFFPIATSIKNTEIFLRWNIWPWTSQ